MELVTVYVSRNAETNLFHGLNNGVWGFTTPSKPNFDLKAGSYLLLATGYSAGSPRVSQSEWVQNSLSKIYFARITSDLYESSDVEFPNEHSLPLEDRYIWRFRFELLQEYRDVGLGILPLDVSDGLRRSAIAQSRPNLIRPIDIQALRVALSSGPIPPLPEPTTRATVSNMIDEAYRQILLAIKTKPFVLLAGISGTGKSRLVRTLAYKTCANGELRSNSTKPGNFELIPVRPNWHDSTELIGFVSRINGEKYIVTPFLKFIAKAWMYPDTPFFLCLDEMNLAPVEQYFAEYLSVIETRANHGSDIGTDYLISKDHFENENLYVQLLGDLGLSGRTEFLHGIAVPNNFVVAGTVNMDETTHSFSRKVLDRGMTFEMNVVDLHSGLGNEDSHWAYPDQFIALDAVVGEFTEGREVVDLFPEAAQILTYLVDVNAILHDSPFKIAYRVRDEFLIYCYYASLQHPKPLNWLDNALDEMTSMKILSRIEGDEGKTGNLLSQLEGRLSSSFNKSRTKLQEMRSKLETSGYTSFWT
jgi:hypothetical protein